MASSDIQLFSVARLFTGHTWLHNAQIQVHKGRVVNISADEVLHPTTLPLLVPAFVDLQLYGAAGRLLSVFPDVDTLDAIRKSCEAGGATHFQPTVATNTPEIVSDCIRAVRQYQQQGGAGCIGLHLEGPWIHPEKRGAHMASYIQRGTLAAAKSLLQEGGDVISMITLAPECCDEGVIDFLLSAGVVVSLGHSQATYNEAKEAFNKGVAAATHLYNAMSSLQHRAPGVVGAIMDHTDVRASIIPDGHHVDYAAIRIAKKVMCNRLFMITDAVTDTQQGPYQHQPAGSKYESAGTLSGSMINMSEGVQNLINHVGIEEAEALRMASLYPASLMGREDLTGTIEVGKPFHAAAFDNQFSVIGLYRGN
jgi:N-acetylglucosamine-6-phosphate deacetylase